MYYYQNGFDYSVEDMIKDYLAFKHTKEGPETLQIKSYTLFTQPNENYQPQKEIKIMNNDELDNYKWFPTPLGELEDEFDLDMNHSKLIQSEVPKLIQPYVERVVDKMDYEGSPIYDDYIQIEAFNQMGDVIYQEVVSRVNELGDVMSLTTQNIYWGKDRLLRGLIETLLANEIFGIRRPRYRHKYKKNYRYL